ncbi:hypothetical protein BU26DRAFT_571732 [Trematosphaeria pertusa]|uniref:Uncharacterized protein n=1 Tax=Trematosphaeria pertusa TaxID=390896 RepID=A0A6A6HTS7_9PLEO|nr:uncharacterized protein BU26DRAFT_571732 [Trematosphaeria pertusa]KAF2241575.1 hypothetical protein BU26DRAFT_571732 [Trematosphaeria pertusa]
MLSSGSGSSPPPPGRGSGPSSTPPRASTTRVRNGATPQTALLSPGLQRNPDEEFRYYVNHLGQWFEVNAQEARQYRADGFAVHNVDTMESIAEFLNPVQPPSTEGAFGAQVEEADRATDVMEEELNAHLGPGVTHEELQKRAEAAKKAKEKSSEPESPHDKKGGPSSDGDKRDPSAGAGAASSSGVAD